MTLRTRTQVGLIALAAAGSGLVLALQLAPGGAAVAGCLAPADLAIDSNGTAGPFWGNDAGRLLYSKLLSPGLQNERDGLLRREGVTNSLLVEAGQSTGDVLGSETERFRVFQAGTMNESGDLALVASTSADMDDPTTEGDDTIARRALFHRRGNTLRRVARFGDPSPVLDQFANPVPWASIFDASLSDRIPNFVEVTFSAQLADGRAGVFVWREESQTVTDLVLTGQSAPVGGEFTSFGRLRANGRGDAAFFGLAQDGANPPVQGLFLRLKQDGLLRKVAQFGLAGDPAPNGGIQSLLKDFDVDDAATVVFASVLANTGPRGGLFRQTLGGTVTTLVLDGDATALGGRFEGISGAQVRVNPDGALVFGAALSDDIGGDGVFTIAPGATAAIPLAGTEPLLAVAALGNGRGAYQDEFETHTIIPADGSFEGPTDFRIAKLVLKNRVPLRQDKLTVDGRFRLPGYGAGGDPAPPVFAPGMSVFTADEEFSGAGVAPIERVLLQISDFPGNAFVFGVRNADTSPVGSLSYNDLAKPAPKVKLGKTGRSITFAFKSDVGNGKLLVDLDQGRFLLKVGGASLRESFLARDFLVAFTLMTADDVQQGRAPEDSFFHRSVEVDADQTGNQGSGLGVKSLGERVPGGTLFVDVVNVKRKLKVAKGQAVPTVTADNVTLSGTLRICPGSTPPSTATLTADLTLGDLVLSDLSLGRKGRRGSKYAFKSPKGSSPGVDLRVDVVKGTFVVKLKGATPLSQLIDADFSGTHATNDAALTVGGMVLPFHLSVARVYEASFDVPMVRQRGGKRFVR